jgi:hypothetical protein
MLIFGGIAKKMDNLFNTSHVSTPKKRHFGVTLGHY